MSIALVPFRPNHLPVFVAMLDDPDIARFTPMPSPVPEGFGESWLGRYDAGRAAGTREAFAITEDGDFVGIAVAPHLDAVARETELGYLVDARARGRGVASRALNLLTRWAFDERDLARAYLRINVGNEASRAVAHRCGYRYEGTLRSTWLKDDQRADAEVWSRLPTDPEPH